MDLSRLLALGGTSPLLKALASDDDYTCILKSLRLVSKEISQLALLGVKLFEVTLRGEDRDTDVGGAGLLQQTKLSKLTLNLQLNGGFC